MIRSIVIQNAVSFFPYKNVCVSQKTALDGIEQ